VSDQERLTEKLRGILALSQKGATEGERQAAKDALDRLMMKYNLRQSDFDSEKMIIIKLDYSDDHERTLALQVVGSIIDANQVAFWSSDPNSNKSRKSKKSIWVEAPVLKAAEILSLYVAFRKDLSKGLEQYTEAFIHSNRIYPATGGKEERELTAEEKAELMQVAALTRNISPSLVRRLING